MKRHADDLTIEHIIELRKRLAEAERQRDNALAYVSSSRKVDVKEAKRLATELYWEAETGKVGHKAQLIIEALSMD